MNRADMLIRFGLVALIILVFAQVRHFEFLDYDDDDVVSGNPHIRQGLTLKGLRWAFTADFLRNSPYSDYWQPVTVMSRMLDLQLFGLRAGGHHLVNVGFHIVNTLLLFGFLRSLTGATWKNGFVAAIFAIHPMQVESVAWITERKDVLSTMFALLTLRHYLKYTQSPSAGYWKSFGLFCLGLMAKPMLVMVPVLMLVLDIWPLRRLDPSHPDGRLLWKILLEKCPFLFLAMISVIVTRSSNPLVFRPTSSEFLTWNMPSNYLWYLGKLFYPTDLAIRFSLPVTRATIGQLVITCGLLVGVSLLAWSQRERQPIFSMGWFWFLAALTPVVGLNPTADRFTYIPMIGLWVAVAWSAHAVARTVHARVSLAVVAIAWISFLAVDAHAQTRFWRNNDILFRRALAVNPNNALAHNNLGVDLCRRGKIDEGLAHLQEAIRLHPDYSDAYNNLGLALTNLRRLDEAMPLYYRAIKLNPGNAVTYDNLGVALVKKGEPEQAIEYFSKAVSLRPDSAEAHRNLGNALMSLKRMKEAEWHLAEAVRLDPGLADAQRILGMILALEGRLDEALPHMQEAVRRNPNDADAQNNLGFALSKAGKPQAAVPHLEEALRLKPDYVEAHSNLGLALGLLGRLEEAIPHFQESLRLNPKYAEAYYTWGVALAQRERYEEARMHFQEALKLNSRFRAARDSLQLLDSKKMNQVPEK